MKDEWRTRDWAEGTCHTDLTNLAPSQCRALEQGSRGVQRWGQAPGPCSTTLSLMGTLEREQPQLGHLAETVS